MQLTGGNRDMKQIKDACMKNSLVVIAFSLLSLTAHAEFVLERASLVVGDEADHVYDNVFAQDSTLSNNSLHEHPGSRIVIEEIDKTELTSRTTTIDVIVRILDNGRNWRSSGTSGHMSITAKSPLKVGDLFGRYEGLVGGIAFFGNLGESLVKRKGKPIFINDFEDLLFGFGFQAAFRTMVILPKNGKNSKNVSVTILPEYKGQTRSHSQLTYEEVSQQVLKSR
jgi:hypothetical protein